MSAFAERALIGVDAPDPHFTGAGHFGPPVGSGGQILSDWFLRFPAY